MLKKLLFLVPGILILIAVILYSDPSELAKVASGADFSFIILALAVSFLSLVLRVGKWWVLLDGVPFTRVFPIQIFGMAFSNFTPGKVAEPTKAILLKMDSGKSVARTLPTIVWERIFDLIVLILMALVGIFFFGLSQYASLGFVAIGIFCTLIIVLLIAMRNKPFGIRIFNFFRRFPIIKRVSKDFIESFYETRMKTDRLFLSFLLTAGAWVLEGFILYYVLLSIGISLNPIMLVSLLALADLIAIASFLPGGLGTFEVVSVLFLGAFGIATPTAAAAIIIFRFASFWFSAFVGALCFIYLSRRINVRDVLK